MAKQSKLKILIQFVQNAFAYALPVFLQQFVVYPLMAKKLGAEVNGQILAAIALNYFVINITATVLVHVRLLKNKEYEDKGIKGDFNIILLIFAILNPLIIIGGSIFYANGSVTPYDLILSVILGLLFLYQNYIVVQYRLELRFKNILINNILICVGYLIGLGVLYYVLPCWQVVFIVPYTMTLIYDLCHTNYIREPLRKTPLFGQTVKQYFILLGSTLLGTVVTYGDRLLLYPLLGGVSVSIFSSAQLVGKMLQMISSPVSSFLLAHLAKRSSAQVRARLKYVVLAVCACAVLYFGCLVISKPLIYFLYPDWAAQSMQYVSLTAANGVLHMLNILINVVVLRFCNSKWQIVKSSVYLVTYMGCSFTLLHFFGLWGFCVGNILASLAELILFVVVLLKEKVIVFKADGPKKAAGIEEI